ncbi:hypothetical protein BaRGS_00009970 [Batillaria attramentaria]|uniref:Uncharacterized protein n=1 Tax=Batillaria attramentaria TaxID=370345 RepID=A0ABD0LHI4_9CAEN
MICLSDCIAPASASELPGHSKRVAYETRATVLKRGLQTWALKASRDTQTVPRSGSDNAVRFVQESDAAGRVSRILESKGQTRTKEFPERKGDLSVAAAVLWDSPQERR